MWLTFHSFDRLGFPTAFPTGFDIEQGYLLGGTVSTDQAGVSWAVREENVATLDPGVFTSNDTAEGWNCATLVIQPLGT